jgi:hypothetical protein
VELDVRVLDAAPYVVRTRVRVALAELSSVSTVLAAPEGNGTQLRLTTTSIAALLTEIGASAALAGSEVTLTPIEGLTLRLADPAVAPLGSEAPDVPAINATAEPRSEHGLRAAWRRMRARWRTGLSIARMLAVPVLITLAVAPRVSRAPSESALPVPNSPDPAAMARVRQPAVAACVPQAKNRPCDPELAARWDGDPAAWRAYAARNGEPPPSLDEIAARTIALRVELGDPKARMDLAEKLGLPAMFLTAAAFGESALGLDIELEIANQGTATADLGGARIEDGTGAFVFVLPDGAQLLAGHHCRLTTTPPVRDACPFTPSLVRRPTTGGPTALTLRSREGERLDTLDPGVAQ